MFANVQTANWKSKDGNKIGILLKAVITSFYNKIQYLFISPTRAHFSQASLFLIGDLRLSDSVLEVRLTGVCCSEVIRYASLTWGQR